LTSTGKGAAAELEIAAAAVGLGLVVLRPLCEGARYDLAIDVGPRVLRVQCKWADARHGVLAVRTTTSRHTPRGYVRSTYSAAEVDAIGAYCPTTDRVYLVPIACVEALQGFRLRLAPTGNCQAANVRWARDFELAKSIERYWRREALGCVASVERAPKPGTIRGAGL
jgi:hypothetical protein